MNLERGGMRLAKRFDNLFLPLKKKKKKKKKEKKKKGKKKKAFFFSIHTTKHQKKNVNFSEHFKYIIGEQTKCV